MFFDLLLPCIMSRGSLALQSGETIVWQGIPFYPKLGLPVVSLVTAGLSAMYYLIPQLVPALRDASQGLSLVFGLLVLMWLYIDAKYRAVTYYITDRRIIRSQRLPILGNTQEIPLQSLVRIRVKRVRGRGYVVFQSRDTSTLTFCDLHENPQEIKKNNGKNHTCRETALPSRIVDSFRCTPAILFFSAVSSYLIILRL